MGEKMDENQEKEAIDNNQEPVTEKQEAIEENQEPVTEKQEVIEENQEPVAENQEITDQNQNPITENKSKKRKLYYRNNRSNIRRFSWSNSMDISIFIC